MRGRGDSIAPPALFGHADAVLSGDGAVPGDDLMEKLVESNLGALAHRRVVHGRNHDVHVDVAISCMTKAGHGESGFTLQFFGEIDQIHQTAARDDDVFVKFDQTGIPQAVAELTAQFPESLAGFVSHRLIQADAAETGDELGKLIDLSLHRLRLAVDFHEQVRIALRGHGGT